MGINASAYGRRDFLKGATAAGAAALAGTGMLATAAHAAEAAVNIDWADEADFVVVGAGAAGLAAAATASEAGATVVVLESGSFAGGRHALLRRAHAMVG